MKQKSIVTVLLFIVMAYASAHGGGREVLAVGEWSEPVANKYGFALRGRLLICEFPSARGLSPQAQNQAALYVEIQECSKFVGAVGEVYWDPEAVDCVLLDQDGKSVPRPGHMYSGFLPRPCWVTLPSYSSMRLRVGPPGGGRVEDGGFVVLGKMLQAWHLKPDDANTYTLQGKLMVNPPTNRVPNDFRYVWQGALELPGIKVGIRELSQSGDQNGAAAAVK